MQFETNQKCIEQLEGCDYQTKDGLHALKDNAAFKQLKTFVENSLGYTSGECNHDFMAINSDVKYMQCRKCGDTFI